MPPKVKISKESIITAAVDIVRKSGAHALNARTVAQILDCSTQPVFSNFASMDDLRLEVIKSAENICRYYIEREINSGLFPAYKASGMAYIRFASIYRQFTDMSSFMKTMEDMMDRHSKK